MKKYYMVNILVHNLRARAERHSVCVTDLSELQSCGSPMLLNHLFVDAKLANSATGSGNNHYHESSSAFEMKPSMWNLPVVFNS